MVLILTLEVMNFERWDRKKDAKLKKFPFSNPEALSDKL
jgi:hypothetical protein